MAPIGVPLDCELGSGVGVGARKPELLESNGDVLLEGGLGPAAEADDVPVYIVATPLNDVLSQSYTVYPVADISSR